MIRRVGLTGLFLLFIAMTGGCGSGDDSASNGSSRVPEAAAPGEAAAPAAAAGKEAIPPAKPEVVEGLQIVPSFDEAGTVSELAVAPGEIFSFYVIARHPGFEMTTAEWRVEVPEGVEVLGEAKAFERALSMGTYKSYILNYPCQTGAEPYSLVRYTCKASPDFEGGVLKTVDPGDALNPSRQNTFIGFVTCVEPHERFPASGGSATLKLK